MTQNTSYSLTQNTAATFKMVPIVQQLAAIRHEVLAARNSLHRPPKLPSRLALTQIISDIASAIYPNRLGPADVSAASVDSFVEYTLNNVLVLLTKQISRELGFKADTSGQQTQLEQDALHIAQQTLLQLPTIRRLLDSDIQAAYEGDPAAESIDEVIVCYPGILAMIHHRIAHALYLLNARLCARMIAEIAHGLTGIDIHPGARIGERCFIDHGTGVVIGESAILGSNVRIYQAVTLGAKRFEKHEDGSLVKGNPRHPIVEDNVVIYAGATILGRITIGKNATIGGNVWVTHNVPPNTLVTQSSIP